MDNKEPILITDHYSLHFLEDTKDITITMADYPSSELIEQKAYCWFGDNALQKEVSKLLKLDVQEYDKPPVPQRGDSFVLCKKRFVDKGSEEDVAKTGYVIELLDVEIL